MNPKNRFSETSSLSQKEADREGKPASIWSQCNLASSCRLLRLPKLFQDAQMRFSSKSPPVNRVNRATASVPPALARSAARAQQGSHSAPFCRSRSDKCNFLKPLVAPPNQPGSGRIVSEASGSRILDWFHFSSGVSFLFSTIYSSVEKLFSIPRFFKRQHTLIDKLRLSNMQTFVVTAEDVTVRADIRLCKNSLHRRSNRDSRFRWRNASYRRSATAQPPGVSASCDTCRDGSLRSGKLWQAVRLMDEIGHRSTQFFIFAFCKNRHQIS